MLKIFGPIISAVLKGVNYDLRTYVGFQSFPTRLLESLNAYKVFPDQSLRFAYILFFADHTDRSNHTLQL